MRESFETLMLAEQEVLPWLEEFHVQEVSSQPSANRQENASDQYQLVDVSPFFRGLQVALSQRGLLALQHQPRGQGGEYWPPEPVFRSHNFGKSAMRSEERRVGKECR